MQVRAAPPIGSKICGSSSKRVYLVVQDELEYKQRNAESGASTQTRLHEELALRRGELAKIDTLEGRIVQELAVLAQKTQGLQQELGTFEGTEELKAQVDAQHVVAPRQDTGGLQQELVEYLKSLRCGR